MTLKKVTFDGTTDGAAVTVATLATGSGDTPDLVAKGTGSAVTSVSTPVAFGTRAVRFDLAASQQTIIRFNSAGSASAAQVMMYLTELPLYGLELFRIAASSGRPAQMNLAADGKVVIYSYAGAVLWTSGAAVPLNQWVRYDLLVVKGTTTSNGRIKGGYATTITSALATPVNTTTGGTAYERTDINAGTLDTTYAQVGQLTANAWAGTAKFYLDEFSVNDAPSDVIAPPAAAAAPTASLTVSDPSPVSGGTVTLTAGGTGTITSRVYTASEIPDGAPTPTFATPTAGSTAVTGLVGGQYLFQVVNTGPGGSSAPATVRVYVHPAAGVDGGVYSTSGTTTWTNVGGAATLVGALNDSNAGTYAESPVNPTGQTLRLVLFPLGLGPIEIDVSGYSDGGAVTSRNITLYKEDGTTVVDTWAQAPVLNTDTIGTLQVDVGGLAVLTGGSDAATLALRRALVLEIASTA